VEWWHQQEHGGVSEGAGAAVPLDLPQQVKQNKKKEDTRSLPRYKGIKGYLSLVT
jgi:hypothetical protein